MSKFKITYKNGATEEVCTDAVDAADQINRTFGLSPEEAKAFGVSVEMLPDAPSEAVAQAAPFGLFSTAPAPAPAQPMSGTFGVSETSEAGDVS